MQQATGGLSQRSLTDNALDDVTWRQLSDVLTLHDYNTRVVVIGVTLLGIASGLIGSFMLLRKRALLGDALSHATLPGIGLAFLAMTALGGDGKWLPGLLIGASVSGALGVLAILAIVHGTRIKEDAALGIVLSVFFGLGIAILSLIQRSSAGNAAGLNSFIYGKTASMLWNDALLIAGAAAGVLLICTLLFKEFALLCFDQAYAGAQGWPVALLDIVMMAVVVAVTVIGLQAVGLILMVALLVIPPAAARFWTDRLGVLLVSAAAIGALSGYFGAAISALAPRLPAGAIIVVIAGLAFAFSMICGARRGVIVGWLQQRRLRHTVARQNLLRALYELSEQAVQDATGAATITFTQLVRQRSWSKAELRRQIRDALREGAIESPAPERYRLTEPGGRAAWRTARNHRLWELFLITHAEIAPSHVDRDADQVEHVLSPEMIEQLEALLREQHPDLARPQSPHPLPGGA